VRPAGSPQDMAVLLGAHPWVAAARALISARSSLLVIVPSDAGLCAYRQVGHAGLAAAWESHLGTSLPFAWKLAESLAAADAGSSRADATRSAQFVSGMPEVLGHELGADGNVHYDLRVPLGLAVFQSHFPAAPIVPGVELIRWVVVLGRRHFRMPEHFAGVDGLRFRGIIQPGVRLRLDLRFVNDSRTLQFTFRSAAGAVARVLSDGRILFRDVRAI
jgi:3-hydroxymyristoyl/3-hydroxydecanoyl-(acyl carrier protein) dehydratase